MGCKTRTSIVCNCPKVIWRDSAVCQCQFSNSKPGAESIYSTSENPGIEGRCYNIHGNMELQGFGSELSPCLRQLSLAKPSCDPQVFLWNVSCALGCVVRWQITVRQMFFHSSYTVAIRLWRTDRHSQAGGEEESQAGRKAHRFWAWDAHLWGKTDFI